MLNTKIIMTKNQELRHSKKKTIVTFYNLKRTTECQKSDSETSDRLVLMSSKNYYPTMIMSIDESTQTKLKFYTNWDYVGESGQPLDDSYQSEKLQRD